MANDHDLMLRLALDITEAARNAQQMADTLSRMGRSAEEAARSATGQMGELDRSTKQAAQGASEAARSMQQMERAADATGAALRRMTQVQKLDAARDILGIRSFHDIQLEIDQVTAAYNRLANSGKLSAQELANANQAHQSAVSRLKAEMTGVQPAMQGAAAAAGNLTQAMRMLPMQMTDVAVSIASGMPVWMVAIQQGGQLKDSFGGIGPAAKAVAGYALALVNPFTVAAAAMAALGTAIYVGRGEAEAYSAALITTGGYAGVTAGQMQAMAASMESTTLTQHAAAEALAAMAATGRIAGDQLSEMAGAAADWSRVTGTSVEDVAKQFVELGKEPVKASVKLDESLHYLTMSVYEQIKALEDEGKMSQAAKVAQDAYAAALRSRSSEMAGSLGVLQRSWMSLAGAAASAWGAMLNLGRADTLDSALGKAKENLAGLQAKAAAVPRSGFLGKAIGGIYDTEIKTAQTKLRDLGIEASDAAKRAGNRAAAAKEVQAKAAWDKSGDSFKSRSDAKGDAIKLARQQAAEAGVSQAELNGRIAAINEKYKGPKGRSGGGGGGAKGFSREQSAIVAVADAQAKAERQSQIDATDAMRADLERRYSSGVMLASDYYAKLKEMASADGAARLAAIDKEIAAEAARKTKNKGESTAKQAKLIELNGKRAHELAIERAKDAEIQGRAEKKAMDDSAALAQQWAQSWQTADQQSQQYAEAAAKAQAQMIVDPLQRARAEAEITAEKIARDGAKTALELSNQIDRLRGAGQAGMADELQKKLDEIRAGIAAEQERARQAPDQAFTNNYLGDQSGPGQKIAEGFDTASQSLSAFVNGFRGLFEVEANYQKALSERGLTAERAAAIEKQHTSQQLGAYAAMAGAAKGFFTQGSAGYKAMATAEKAFRAYEMGLAIKNAAEKMGLISAVTAAKVTGDATQTASTVASVAPDVAASMAKGQAAAVSGVAAQASGDPYTAFPRIAAMVAIMAALGFAVRGGGGGGGVAPTNSGTGTVLGDKEAKSESLKKSLEDLGNINSLTMRYSAQMAASLHNIEAGIGGVGNLLVQGGGLQANTASINTAVQRDAIGNFIGKFDVVGMIASSIPLIGGILGRDAAKLANLFGSKQSVEGSGLSVGKQTLGSVAANGADASYYADIKTTKKFFGITTGTSMSTQYTGVGDELNSQFTKILAGFSDTVKAAAGPLGASLGTVQDALSKYVVDIGRIDLKDLNGTQISEKLTAVFGAEGDKIARAALAGMDGFQRIGEGYLQTVVRVSSAAEGARASLDRLGVSAIALPAILNKQGDIATELVRQSITTLETTSSGAATSLGQIIGTLQGTAQDLADTYSALRDVRQSLTLMGVSGESVTRSMVSGAGSLDALKSGMSTFEDKFFSDTEKTQFATARMGTEFQRLGLTMPTTSAGFRSLVTGIDTSTEAGQKMLGSLLNLSGGFADLMSKTNGAAAAVTALTQAQQDSITADMARLGIGKGANLQQVSASAGGSDALNSGMGAFEKRFFAESEQVAASTSRLQAKFSGLGVTMPQTAEQFRALVSGIDASSEAGAKLLGGVLPLSTEFADLMDSMKKLGDTAGNVGKSVESEITRIRGLTGQANGGTLSGAQADFTIATAKARAGDSTALDSLAGLSQNLLKIAGDQATSREALLRLQAQTAASLQATLDKARSTTQAPTMPTPSATATAIDPSFMGPQQIPAFASGGNHLGGLRLVGEHGPELEVTGPSRIFNAGQTADMLRGGGAAPSGGSALLAELQALRASNEAMANELHELRAESRSSSTTIATHTGRMSRILDRVTAGGDTFKTEVVTT